MNAPDEQAGEAIIHLMCDNAQTGDGGLLILMLVFTGFASASSSGTSCLQHWAQQTVSLTGTNMGFEGWISVKNELHPSIFFPAVARQLNDGQNQPPRVRRLMRRHKDESSSCA